MSKLTAMAWDDLMDAARKLKSEQGLNLIPAIDYIKDNRSQYSTKIQDQLRHFLWAAWYEKL